MEVDLPLLKAVLANPGDEATRLVYADWLEERGDSRGAFLRLDTVLAKLHGNSTEYPEMRDKWLELRRIVDDRWARAVSFRPISTIEGMVHFLRELHRPWMESPALNPTLIPDDLPYGLALIYRELGALVEMERTDRMPFATQDALVPLSLLERESVKLRGGKGGLREYFCTFAWENQSNWSCRCHLREVDPPVYSNAHLWQEPARGFQKVCDSLNSFLITLCLHEAVFSSPCLMTVDSDEPSDYLKVEYSPLWLSGPYVNPEETIDFYAVAEADAIIMNGWIGSHSDASPILKERVKPNRIH